MSDEIMHCTRTVAAPAESVFAVLADPSTHAAIDGTGWVGDPVDDERITTTGQVFRIGMYHRNHPNGHYEMANLITAFDPARSIAWKPGQDDGSGTIGYGGWIWRYDLEPADAGTRVTLTYDWSAVPAEVREFISFPPFAQAHLEDSLAHLEELATARR